MEIPFYIKILFYALVLFCFWFLMSFTKKGVALSNMDREKGARFQGRLMLGLIAWLMLLAVLALAGFFMNFEALPPRPAFMFVVTTLATIYLLTNKTFHQIAIHVPAQDVANFQAFRAPLEVLLWLLAINEVIPKHMTFEGYNFDVVPAILAPIVAFLVFKQKKLPNWVALAWNIFGISTVAIIVTIATLSTPSPIRQFMQEPANTIIGYFPYVWLPGFLVPMAFLMHFVNIKQILHLNKNKHAE